MGNTEVSLTEEGDCGIPSSATEFRNGKLENNNFTKHRLMHIDCILLSGPYIIFDSYILFVLIWDRRKKNGSCRRSPEAFSQSHLVVSLLHQDPVGSDSDQGLCKNIFQGKGY